MVSETMERALQFLRNHKDVALATSEDNIPKLRIFQVMKQEGNVLYFATSEKKAVWRELRKNPNVELQTKMRNDEDSAQYHFTIASNSPRHPSSTSRQVALKSPVYQGSATSPGLSV